MGRKPNIKPIDNLNLLFGSQIHWDDYTLIDNGNNIAFLVTCGICGKDRRVRRSAMRYSLFSGVCLSCARKNINRPPRAYPGFKTIQGYSRSINKSGYVHLVINGLSPEDQELCKGMEQGNGPSPVVLEHRLVMARMLGRPLSRKETVHHKHEPKSDNRPENLELRIGQHGKGFLEEDILTENIRLRKILDEHNISY